jgi:hypothetical protein
MFVGQQDADFSAASVTAASVMALSIMVLRSLIGGRGFDAGLTKMRSVQRPRSIESLHLDTEIFD